MGRSEIKDESCIPQALKDSERAQIFLMLKSGCAIVLNFSLN